jgi:hypothetical protein
MSEEEKKEVKIKEYFQVLQGERRDLATTVSAASPAVPQPEPIKKEAKKQQ